MPSVDWNHEVWGSEHKWDSEGDEWSGMAAYCGQPYPEWKAALVDTFLLPDLTATSDVLEVAPGHGRWSSMLVGTVRSLTLVDLSQSCIDACRERFADASNVTYIVNDGTSLFGVADESIDFVWSFDSFVHMERDVIASYLREFARVLRPGGRIVIHHADKRPVAVKLAPMLKRAGTPGRVVLRLVGQGRLRDSGNRAEVSRSAVARDAQAVGLSVLKQTDRWGADGKCTVGKYHDTITLLSRP
jgi:ubiquinone/menaquinone biosynthesis C-methylase UbiE